MPTLKIQLWVDVVGKMLTHNVAMYSSSLRQTAQATLLAAASAKWLYPALAWATWCSEVTVGKLPLLAQRSICKSASNERPNLGDA